MNLLLLSIRGLRSFMYCELISALVVLLIKYTSCQIVAVIKIYFVCSFQFIF